MTDLFWRTKRLDQMDRAEWESLCDGCGRCCLLKLEDVDSGEIAFTSVACRLFDGDTCRCTMYGERFQHVPDCVQLDPAKASGLPWLPPTCAYRLVAEGSDLYWWHPLVSGDPTTVHQAGISVRGRTVPEWIIPESALEDHVVDWVCEEPGIPPSRQSGRKKGT